MITSRKRRFEEPEQVSNTKRSRGNRADMNEPLSKNWLGFYPVKLSKSRACQS